MRSGYNQAMKITTKLGWSGIAVLVCLAVLLAVSSGTAADRTGAKDRGHPNPYSRFPLWKDVPGRSFAKLGEGSLPNRTRWGVYASKGAAGAANKKLPCVSVATITRQGIYGNATECGRP